MKKAPAVVLGLVLGLGFVAEAVAESPYCEQLQADYRRALRDSGGGGGGGGANIGKIQRQLAAAQNDAKRAGCRRILFGKPGKNCPAIMARVNQLQRDLARARTSGGGLFANNSNSRYERDRLRSALARNGCNVPSSRDGGQSFAGSGYRTLCVRTCDGYYFPISFSTNRSRFKIDEAVCQSMYGGQSAELFVHASGSPVDTAVSLRGEPIDASTNAFAYRHFFSPSCQGQLQRGLANLGEAFLARVEDQKSTTPARNDQAPSDAPSLLPIPVARIAPGQDPETLANLAGQFTIAPVVAEEDASGEAVAVATPMRKLGPDYYYTTPISIEALRNPPQRGPVFSLIGTAHASEADDGAPETSVQ
ncbi:MAG: DUF2865 domain-containing protein [Rhizobiales bacterium]|nr:DUF2865 domain-containing protein [Hyphomicrobiales bacterium]